MKTILDSVNQSLSTQRGESSIADRALQIWHDTQSPEAVVSAFEQLDAKVDEWMQVGILSAHGLSLALAQIQKIWDQIPPEKTSRWNYDFWEYARWRSNRSQSTVRNYITIARTFLSGETRLPNQPEKFDPWKVDQSTLLLAAHAAKTGKMDEKAWNTLASPDVTYTAMQEEISRLRQSREDRVPTDKPRFFIAENKRLCFIEDGVTITLGELEDVDFVVDEDGNIVGSDLDENEKEKLPYYQHGLTILRNKLGIE